MCGLLILYYFCVSPCISISSRSNLVIWEGKSSELVFYCCLVFQIVSLNFRFVTRGANGFVIIDFFCPFYDQFIDGFTFPLLAQF